MSVTNHSDVDTIAARKIWAEFQTQHDMSGREGQTAGIDPVSQRVWIGDTVQQVVGLRDAEGCDAPLFFVRIGSPTYYRNGGRR